MFNNRLPQPSDLLNVSTTLQASSDGSSETPLSEMDPDRRRWLEGAFSETFGTATDMVKDMQAQLEILKDLNRDQIVLLNALELLKEFTEHIDFSNDFHKIGGYSVLQNLFNDDRPELRSSAAQLLGQLMQNNPYCQEMALNERFLTVMLNLLENDPSQDVKKQILGAISSLVRSNQNAQNQFYIQDGLSVLVRSMTTTNDAKFQTKAAFMLNSICGDNQQFGKDLGEMGIVHHFVPFLKSADNQLREQVLEALLYVLKHSEVARNEAQQPNLDLRGSLSYLRSQLTDADQYLEELNHIYEIENVLDGK